MLGSDDTTKTPIGEGPAAPPPGATTPPPAAPAAQAAPPAAWSPSRAERDRGPALIGGTIVLLIGLWFFATTTLGLDLPRIDWRQSWPVILIVVGLLILLRAFRRAR